MRSTRGGAVAAVAAFALVHSAPAQSSDRGHEILLGHATEAVTLTGLPPMTEARRPGAPSRELRIHIDYFGHEPSFVLRLIDSAGLVRAQRVIYWSGKYSGFGPSDGQGHEGLGFPIGRKLYLDMRGSVLRRFPCDSVRASLITEACRLNDYPSGSARHLLAMLDSLGIARLPWDENMGLDGGSVAVENWDGRTYRWYFYWEPNATSLNPSVRAAAEITRRVWAIFERRSW